MSDEHDERAGNGRRMTDQRFWHIMIAANAAMWAVTIALISWVFGGLPAEVKSLSVQMGVVQAQTAVILEIQKTTTAQGMTLATQGEQIRATQRDLERLQASLRKP